MKKDIKNQNQKQFVYQETLYLKKWQTLAIKNSRENKVFKRLLNSTSHQVDVIKTASVINQSPGIYTNLITINAGKSSKVNKDLAVINEKGLVGKTVFSTKNNSKVHATSPLFLPSIQHYEIVEFRANYYFCCSIISVK